MYKFFKLLFLIIPVFVYSQKISLSTFPDDKIMVVAHRGDWREAPENSIWAVKKAIEKGVDMVELDISMTKDSIIILMHDKTVDRTTTGKGKPIDFTYQELQRYYLKDGSGNATQMKIPKLEDVLDLTKGKVLLNLDKGFNYIDKIYPMLVERDMLDEVLFKGTESFQDFNQKYGNIKDKIQFMPIIRLAKNESWEKIYNYLNHYNVYGFEFTVGTDESNLIDFISLKEKGIKVWVNSLWAHHNAGNNDDKALEDINVYNWYVDRYVNIIQTDRPNELIKFLESKNLKY